MIDTYAGRGSIHRAGCVCVSDTVLYAYVTPTDVQLTNRAVLDLDDAEPIGRSVRGPAGLEI